MQETWVGKIHWRRKWLSTPVFLPGGSLEGMGYGPWGPDNHHWSILAFLVAQLVKNLSAMWENWFHSWEGRSPGEENSYPLQHSGLENSMDCIVHGVAKSWTQLRDFHFHYFIDYIKTFECVGPNEMWKILKEMGIPDHLPASWEICMQVKKQQLEPNMEQQTCSKLGKEYVKAVYCHLAYLTNMQSISWEVPGWMKQKPKSRLLDKIPTTSDMHMTPPVKK